MDDRQYIKMKKIAKELEYNNVKVNNIQPINQDQSIDYVKRYYSKKYFGFKLNDEIALEICQRCNGKFREMNCLAHKAFADKFRIKKKYINVTYLI